MYSLDHPTKKFHPRVDELLRKNEVILFSSNDEMGKILSE